jgi:integrase
MVKRNAIYAKISTRNNKYVTIYFKNHHFPTPYRIENTKDFNRDTQKFSKDWLKNNPDALEIIENLKLKINTLIKKAREEGLKELAFVKRSLEEENNKIKRANITDNIKISEAFKKFIFKVINKEIKRANSKERYNSHLNKIVWFEETNDTKLSQITMDYIFDIIRWMAEKKTYVQEVNKDKKWGRTYTATKTVRNSNSTIKRWLSDFNRFLKWCAANNNTLSFPYEEISKLSYSLKTPQDHQEIIAMTPQQWEAFKNFKLPSHMSMYQNSYDAYYYCVKTGLRASDFSKLYNAYVTDRTIVMKASKTDARFEVTMSDDAHEIYLKYGCDFRSKFPTIQRLSINLRKILALIPEFCHDDIKYEYYLDEVVEVPIKNYEKFTFHSSRRTCATFLAMSAPSAFILKTLGWTNLRMLENYLDVLNSQDNKEKSYFNF